MRYLVLLIFVWGCAGGGRIQQKPVGRDYSTVEYFNSRFDQVVDATYAAVSNLGMYVEDRYRSGFDQVISVQSVSAGSATNMVITIAQPTAQGVAVAITSESGSLNPMNFEHEAEAILRGIAVRLGM